MGEVEGDVTTILDPKIDNLGLPTETAQLT
jgi:hypothetical protein